MNKLIDIPATFVSYTLGAGGMFLTSVIHYLYNTSDDIKFDRVGSGHANLHISQINHFYKDSLLDEFGRAIVNDDQYDKWAEQERIDFLQTGLNRFNPNQAVISLHCANMGLFLKSFKNSKFIKVNVSNKDIETCRYNVLYKRFRESPDLFRGLVADYGRQFDQECVKLKRLSKQDFEDFAWIDEEIIKFANMKEYTDSNVLNISYYDEYMNGDNDEFLNKIIDFLELSPTQEEYDNIANALMMYKATQPKVPE